MNKFESEIVENMKALGIYQPEFVTTISIYCGLVDQYQALEKEFKKSKFTVVEKTGYSDNNKKNPLVGSMESLRKDILSYSNALRIDTCRIEQI